MERKELQAEFKKRYKKDSEHIFFSPGRVNLIGEHIDYNGGKVLPCAITKGTWLAVARNVEKVLRFQCLNFPETAELHLQNAYTKSGKAWYNYPLGVINELLQRDATVSGLDLLYYGNIPIAAGLSSSASIEVLTAFAFSELFGLDVPKTDMALLSQHAENHFIGVNCGIMDQFTVAMGKKDKAILLDCDTIMYEYYPFALTEYQLLIVNSKKDRTLADSKYNERYSECMLALEMLNKKLDLRNLCEISIASFQQHKELITDNVLQKRALHVVTENQRVKDAVIALQTNDLETLGKLMFSSHQSLKELYEVSGKELDTIVEFSKNYPGCIGARMTGAGFGGCAIAIVKKDQIEDYTVKLNSYYSEAIGYNAEVFATEAADGVH
jgi:galactokinase